MIPLISPEIKTNKGNFRISLFYRYFKLIISEFVMSLLKIPTFILLIPVQINSGSEPISVLSFSYSKSVKHRWMKLNEIDFM